MYALSFIADKAGGMIFAVSIISRISMSGTSSVRQPYIDLC